MSRLFTLHPDDNVAVDIDTGFKKALKDMRGAVYSTPEHDQDEGPKGTVLIEDVTLEQSSPDLLEVEVGYYRRMYTVRLDYQTEEVRENED